MNVGYVGIFTALLCIIVQLTSAERKALNDYVEHYETLNYDSASLHNTHSRVRRSTSNPSVHLKFQAHGKFFNIRMKRDVTTFSKDANVDTSHIYEGELVGEHGSEVHGSIINGIFAGFIKTPRETYWVERADVHFRDEQPFHSIIYAEKDMNLDPHRFKRNADRAQCGSKLHNVHEWMKGQQESAIHDGISKREAKQEYFEENEGFQHNYYTSSRHKRANINERTCTLFLQSDTMLWDYFTGDSSKGGLGYSEVRAREEISSLFGIHVKGLKSIYEDTVFESKDGSKRYTGISFVVRRVQINETNDCPDGSNTPADKNPFCKPNVDVSNYLNINSFQNHDDFCLAYAFTYRDFTGGTLGLAWVAATSHSSGGICERYKDYTDNGKRVWKSLNTGIVTLINYGIRVAPKVSTLTFAHEVGHNFGSPHDDGAECTPFSTNQEAGNYIMFASATSGDRPNNNKFSPCSRDNISEVLDAVFNQRYNKHNCFVEAESAFCGNMIVEVGEECDCGYQVDCTDKCCHGRGSGNDCKLKDPTSCSPSQGPCCTDECEKVRMDDNVVCKEASDCTDVQYCNGIDATCPEPTHKDNMTSCSDDTKVCISGECTGSVCMMINWEQCYISAPKDDKNFDKGNLCFVSCLDPTKDDAECVSTGDPEAVARHPKMEQLLSDLGSTSIKLPPGAPCDNFQGYCDVFQKCRGVDADGPLARLKNLLFNEETFTTIKDWIIRYWWAVSLMGIGLVIAMALFIKLCAVHTPSSNPKKPPARKISFRPSHNQGPPPGYPGQSRGGPPHGKGRGASRAGNYEMRGHRKV